MSLPKTGESEVTGTAVIEPELSRHWPKRLARLLDVPPETARFWVYKRMPVARRREIALALVAECDRLEMMIAEMRRRWAEVAGDEARGTVARGAVDRDRPPTGGVGRSMTE